MAVTSQRKPKARPRNRTGRKARPKKVVKRRNAPAAALADRRYRKRVVRSAKTYSRKGKLAIEDETE